MTRWLDGQQPLAAVNARTDAEVAGIIASMKKEDRRHLSIHNPSAYTKLKYYAESGMENKFTLVKTIDTDDDPEALKKIYNITVRVEEFKNELVRYDIAHPFENIADDFETDGMIYFPSIASTGRNLFSGHKHLTLENCMRMSKFWMEIGQEFHAESLLWSGTKLLNSCDEEFATED